MIQIKACKDCKHFHKEDYENHSFTCFRPRLSSRFDPYDGILKAGPNMDIFEERNSNKSGYCGIDGKHWEANP